MTSLLLVWSVSIVGVGRTFCVIEQMLKSDFRSFCRTLLLGFLQRETP